MNRKKKYIVPAFTIFEVTVVLAIMSVLITIISTSVNRFNEQLKVSTDVHTELNHWRSVRSVIWNDFYMADSIQCEMGELTLFTDGSAINYKVQDDYLHRKTSNEWLNLNVEAESIYKEEKNEAVTFHMLFPWKGEPMDLSYHYQTAVDMKINNYFDRLN